MSKSIANEILREGRFLCGAHASAIAQQLGRHVVVVQPAGRDGEQMMMASGGRGGYLSATIYPSGLGKPRCDVKKEELVSEVDGGKWAAVLAAKPLLIYLEGRHYSPLLTLGQREATLFPPSKLMKTAKSPWAALAP